MNENHAAERETRGIALAVVAFVIWGSLPLYLRALDDVPPLELVAHGIAWSCLSLHAYLGLRGTYRVPWLLLRDPETRRGLCLSAGALAVNWMGLVWAVSTKRTLVACLGYLVGPAFSEPIRVPTRLKLTDILGVVAAVAFLYWICRPFSALYWLVIVIGASYGCYCGLRNTIAVEPVTGLAAETTLLTPLALLVLGHGLSSRGTFYELDEPMLLLVGVLSVVPLAAFADGARAVRSATLSKLQFIAPAMMFFCSAIVFGESLRLLMPIGVLFAWAWMGALRAEAHADDRARRALSRRRSGPGRGTTPT